MTLTNPRGFSRIKSPRTKFNFFSAKKSPRQAWWQIPLNPAIKEKQGDLCELETMVYIDRICQKRKELGVQKQLKA